MGVRSRCITFDDFSDTSSLTLNGSALTTMNSQGQTVLRLTGPSTFQAGSAFTTRTISLTNGFSTFFTFQMTEPGGGEDPDGPGADGIVFIVQSSPNTALGEAGGGIGYLGIPNSVGVEFDTFFNVQEFIHDPNGNHVGIDINGSVESIAANIVLPDRLNNGNVWFAWVDYSPVMQLLEVRVSTANVRPNLPTLASQVDLFGILGSQEGFVGFSAGTGQLFENHDILSWEFCIPAC